MRRFLIGCFSIGLIALIAGIVFVVVLFLSFSQEYRSPEELADAGGQFAEINGASIYYLAKGVAENPAVILIHGFGGSSFTWRDNMDALAEAGYYLVALDLPPFGLSDKSSNIGYSRADFADYVVGLMDLLEIETASIVGHSMGATVASYFVVNYPERVDKLILVDGGIFEGETNESENNRQSPFAFLSNIDPSSPYAAQVLRVTLRPNTFAEIMSSAYYNQDFITEELVAGYARPLQIEEWPYGFLAFLQAEQSQVVSMAEFVESATMPVLIIWGEEDTWIPISRGEGIRDNLSNVSFESFPLVGHLPMEESIEAFNETVIDFLGK